MYGAREWRTAPQWRLVALMLWGALAYVAMTAAHTTAVLGALLVLAGLPFTNGRRHRCSWTERAPMHAVAAA